MADKTYDAIVIGSGHNGLVTACYLQDAGVSTVVIEKYHEVGGGVSGLEAPLPGFLANDCAADTRLNQMPVFQDQELYNYGYKGIFPDVGSGTIFDDETCIISYPPFVVTDEKASKIERSENNIAKTMKEIARFSEKDADTYYYLMDCWERRWRDAYWEYRFNPPAPLGVTDPLERLVTDKECPIDQRWMGISLDDLVRDLFDSEEMQLHFLAFARGWVGGSSTVVTFCHIFFLFPIVFDVLPVELIKGGTHTFAHSLQRRFSSRGGEFFVESEVDKVLVENGKARGVRLVDGTEIEARKMVVSNLNLLQTYLRFLGEENVDRKLARRIRNQYHMSLMVYPDVLWGHLAVHELPKYKAENFNPDCSRLSRIQTVPKDIEWWHRNVMAQQAILAMDRPRSWAHHQDSLFDRRAPDGKHQMMLEQYGILPDEPTERGYRDLKKRYPLELLKEWEKFAPNMTRENLIGWHFYAGADIEKKGIGVRGWPGAFPPGISRVGRNLPLPELSQYRMLPVENYYLASPFAHETGCVITSPGYNCYKVIANDFGLKKPWEEKGRPY